MTEEKEDIVIEKCDLTLVTLNQEQIEKAKAVNDQRKQITHALVCGHHGQLFGTEKFCRKYYSTWLDVFPLLFDKCVETDNYEISDFESSADLVNKLMSIQDPINEREIDKKIATATEETNQNKKCIKCKKDIDQDAQKCPHCRSNQVSGKQMAIGCLVFIIIAVVLGSCMSMCGSGGPPAMVDTSGTIEAQRKQAEKLKFDAYVISQQFIKKQLKASSSAKFESYDKNMITWVKRNEFTCSMYVDPYNNCGAKFRANFWTKVKYTGKGNWILLDIKQRK